MRLAVLLLISADLLAQSRGNTILRGCLQGASPHIFFTAQDQQEYTLVGNTAGLDPYSEREVAIQGSINASTKSPSFYVTALKQVFETPKPTLAAFFADTLHWQHETDQQYGVQFAHPRQWTRISEDDQSIVEPSFEDNSSSVAIGQFYLDPDTFPGSNLVTGEFDIYVNPAITNSQSCSTFANANGVAPVTEQIGSITYSALESDGVATGTVYIGRVFHTFQNGQCYEIDFKLGEVETANYPLGCNMPVLTKGDQLKIVQPVLASVIFAAPATASNSTPDSQPQVLAFQASTPTADFTANHGRIKFTWFTRNADYVQFSYSCSPVPNFPGVAIEESDAPRQCDNANDVGGNTIRSHAANGSTTVFFGNLFCPQPISVTVTLTPFSRAAGNPVASKSLTVRALPFRRP